MLRYKGYAAVVNFDDHDKILHGEILNIRDMVTFECEDLQGIELAFHNAVDDYVAMCKEKGRTPNKPYSGTTNLRLGTVLHEMCALAAAENDQSLNDWIIQQLNNSLHEHNNASKS
ncbi:hypothetical protein AVI51_13375 [Piscirickettsia salmonis]|uniref:Type II toxin-antitoxin system HicB family antitoxin n=1 Tax=Piscirickettsia salmonis TaxID=1238 RepID=A0A9Q6PT00_PISSA|nr:type II toxin-antitoxin system HicB family antitoxin [Piscirickettsia salmonis]APS51740.1 hypothetical protein AVI50_13495 [Piscirickettsia salmonis]APS54959.1 hypothetical protein AVI51_13375 [Piscirickettsia salmonis]QGN94003.1 hypothetical protein Psal006a_00574 [Piscirickettsia salmonis]QGO04946.1 hypothetical protein Psal009_00825 [Piscirickettsia salmonis]QGO33267.1 hypothetical protein Psal028_00572 [Piscirickettsia salmonis]